MKPADSLRMGSSDSTASSLSERTVILRSGGGEAAGATKNLIVEALDNQKARFFGPSGASE